MKKLWGFGVVLLLFTGNLQSYVYDVKNDTKGLLFVGFYGGKTGSVKMGEMILQAGEQKRFESKACTLHLYIKGEHGGSLAGLEQDYYMWPNAPTRWSGFAQCSDRLVIIGRRTISSRAGEKSTSFVVIRGMPEPFIVSERPL